MSNYNDQSNKRVFKKDSFHIFLSFDKRRIGDTNELKKRMRNPPRATQKQNLK